MVFGLSFLFLSLSKDYALLAHFCFNLQFQNENYTKHMHFLLCLFSMSVSSLIKCLVRSFQFKSVAQSCLTLCHPMDCSTPCPSPTPGAYSNSWCPPTISSSVVPFSSCLQSCPASGSFPVSHFFTSGDQSQALLRVFLRTIVWGWPLSSSEKLLPRSWGRLWGSLIYDFLKPEGR